MRGAVWVWIVAAIVVTGTVAAAVFWIISTADSAPCSATIARDAWDRCQDARNYTLSRGGLIASITGIMLSAASMGALIVTIYYSARATRAAGDAAAAAQEAVGLSREASIRELRPYMTATQLRNMYANDKDGKIISRYIEISWQNTGQTPAINVRARTNYGLFLESLPEDFPFNDHNSSDIVGSVGRNGTFNSSTPTVTIEDASAVIRGDKIMHVWGWVEYDGFQQDVRYRSEYHARISFWGSTDPQDTGLNATFHLEDGFNGSDDLCTRRMAAVEQRQIGAGS